MAKEKIKHITSLLPDTIKDIAEVFKSNFDKHGEEILGQASGSAAIIVRLFGQSAIDAYFDKLKDKKLAEFGLASYAKAALAQAVKSVENIETQLSSKVTSSYIEFAAHFTDTLLELSSEELLTVFNPQYHPLVIQIRKAFEETLKQLGESNDTTKEFIKNFNDGISQTVKEVFATAYDKHMEQIKEYIYDEREVRFLNDMYELRHIGFRDGENLKYETTFGQWREVDKYTEKENEGIEESKLFELNELCFDAHFTTESLGKILFVIADFGKGKSVFLKQFASKLAKEYTKTKNCHFPIYFNLREFKKYSSTGELGVLGDFLLTKYGIDVKDGTFKNKKFYFLVDSLDESGDLNKYHTEKVIESVKKIENIDKEKYRWNRIIITSRPFDGGLQTQLSSHGAKITEDPNKRKTYYFLSLYGFKKEQFNNWLCNSLMPYKNDSSINQFINKIFGDNCEFYDKLTTILSASELRRPIFGYMIFQLLINKINFVEIGKIGVYLSFLNLLTKDAKHVNDIDYSVNLLEEFEFRNLLHKIAALWVHERQKGKQGSLKKVDIYRAVHESNSGKDDEILHKCKNDTSMQMQFLSHSYFGENDDMLHFQHQSFAEILIAEYYLKIFIKYALDKGDNTEEARVKLMLGEPTAQTIEFLKELIKVLKDSTEDNPTAFEKRKLLYPLMASLSIEKNNKLVCHYLGNKWFDEEKIKNNGTTEYPQDDIEKWCIGSAEIEKIIVLAKNILESDNTYMMAKAEPKTALYDNELIKIDAYLANPASDIDKWLALLVGNELETNILNEKFFNARIEKSEVFFELIRSRNFYNTESAPEWAKGKCFIGIDMKSNSELINISIANIVDLNFSYSYLKNIDFGLCVATRSVFDHCTFVNTDFTGSYFFDTSMQNIRQINDLVLYRVNINGLVLPDSLSSKYSEKTHFSEYTNAILKISSYSTQNAHWAFKTLSGILIYGLKNKLFTIDKMKKSIEFSIINGVDYEKEILEKTRHKK